MEERKGKLPILKKSDFETNQEVRWCPGCGDYSVLASMQRFMAKSGMRPEKTVFVSGIGCSSRFPYYMNTYGFHSIHGRAPAIASGIKLANPELSVWIVTGDGDALSIGGNHFVHLLRRNLDVNIVLFNNRIYGLTKGQYSPTSEQGKITKSSPFGAPDQALNPALLALGSQATFVARCLDVDVPMMTKIFEAAEAHRGTSFIEIYQNCNIFNDGAFSASRNRDSRPDNVLMLEDGEPLIFGSNKDKGLRIECDRLKVVSFDPEDKHGALKANVTVYDVQDRQLANTLVMLPSPPEFPEPMGIIYRDRKTTIGEFMREQYQQAAEKRPIAADPDQALSDLFNLGDTWEIS